MSRLPPLRLRLCLLALLPLLSLRTAEAPPPSEEPPAAAQPAPASEAAETADDTTTPPPQDAEEPPLEPISADNNLTFPVDI